MKVEQAWLIVVIGFFLRFVYSTGARCTSDGVRISLGAVARALFAARALTPSKVAWPQLLLLLFRTGIVFAPKFYCAVSLIVRQPRLVRIAWDRRDNQEIRSHLAYFAYLVRMWDFAGALNECEATGVFVTKKNKSRGKLSGLSVSPLWLFALASTRCREYPGWEFPQNDCHRSIFHKQ